MKTYKIVLKSTGGITQLPDSQKVFGTLITRYSEINGDDKATEFVKAVDQKKLHFALSNVMPLDYFPMPVDYLSDKIPDTGYMNRPINKKEKRKALKERSFIKIQGLKEIFRYPERVDKIYPYVKQTDSQQLRASILNDDCVLEGMETKLYSVPVLNLEERKNSETKGIPVSQYCFYLQKDESILGDSMLSMLNELLQKKVTLIMGKRASQGLNKYRIESIEPMELTDTDCYLNLGMLLSDQIDFQRSALKLFTSERRPFVLTGGWNQEAKTHFISFIDAGSIIKCKDNIKNVGKCVPSPYCKDRDIVFGNAFLYPILEGRK